MLNIRSKWNEVLKDLNVGDVVLELDQSSPCARWPLRRIRECYLIKDGHTRVLKVQCIGRTVVHPIHKLNAYLHEHVLFFDLFNFSVCFAERL